VDPVTRRQAIARERALQAARRQAIGHSPTLPLTLALAAVMIVAGRVDWLHIALSTAITAVGLAVVTVSSWAITTMWVTLT
jgi:hypothetical protein